MKAIMTGMGGCCATFYARCTDSVRCNGVRIALASDYIPHSIVREKVARTYKNYCWKNGGIILWLPEEKELTVERRMRTLLDYAHKQGVTPRCNVIIPNLNSERDADILVGAGFEIAVVRNHKRLFEEVKRGEFDIEKVTNLEHWGHMGDFIVTDYTEDSLIDICRHIELKWFNRFRNGPYPKFKPKHDPVTDAEKI